MEKHNIVVAVVVVVVVLLPQQHQAELTVASPAAFKVQCVKPVLCFNVFGIEVTVRLATY